MLYSVLLVAIVGVTAGILLPHRDFYGSSKLQCHGRGIDVLVPGVDNATTPRDGEKETGAEVEDEKRVGASAVKMPDIFQVSSVSKLFANSIASTKTDLSFILT